MRQVRQRVPWTLMMFASLLTGCEPCTGVASCEGAPRVAATGRLLDEVTGAPVAGATVAFVRTGGVALEQDSVATVTTSDGLFTIKANALAEGDVVGTFILRNGDSTLYRVLGETLRTSRRLGEARIYPPWSTRPRQPDLAEFYARGPDAAPLKGVQIEFFRTSGVELNGNGYFSAVTDTTGFIPLFGNLITPKDVGDLIGDLVVHHSAGPSIRRGAQFRVTAEFRPSPILRRLTAGPSLEYHFEVNPRGRYGVHAEGVTLHFKRTGGIRIDPDSFAVVTDVNGRALFRTRALEYGVLRFDVTVVPPAPWKPYVRTGFEFESFDSDSSFLFTILGVGPGMPYYLRLHANGTAVKGAQVRFQRTSGISVNPGDFTAPTNDSGFVFLTPDPAQEGEVVADITVTPPAPHAPFVVRGLRLQAIDADVPGGRILAGDWDVTAPPASPTGTSARALTSAPIRRRARTSPR